MRRSSTTRSPPATVLRRLQGEKLLQNSAETSNPSNPPIIRMIPTVLRLNPEVFASTAKVRMAPTTNKNRLKPIPTSYLLGPCVGAVRGRHRQAATTLKERRQDGGRYRHCHKPD